jgi:murein DD-endopeptidase MepM/ murein hydrolase activator NlpD
VKKDKGSFKKQKKYFSIMFIPHSPDKMRVVKVSGFARKMGMLAVVTLTVVICASMLLTRAMQENSRLKDSLAQMHKANLEQNALLADKARELDTLKAKEQSIDRQIRDFTEKYKQITDTFIAGKISSTASSRSGDRSAGTFLTDIQDLRNILGGLKELDSTRDQISSELSETEKKLSLYLDSLPTLFPAKGPVSSPFGSRRDPLTRKQTYHHGMDIAAEYGSAICSAGAGKVIFCGRDKVLGLAVIVDHGNGLTTAYGHTSRVLVKEGQQVKKGDPIARVGNSGRSTGAHLHFEVRLDGSPTDPKLYLDGM